jgi:hypothetical protein
MNCKKTWAQDFLVEKLNKSFVTSDYKVHRAQLLCEREISKLPETMAAAENHKAAEKEIDQYHQLNAKVAEMRRKIHEIRCQSYIHWHNAERLRNGLHKQEKKEFVMPCQADGCRGFLSTAYKCGLCSIYTCPKCLEPIGYTKDGDGHTCKEESVQSAELIRKDTKPCPCCGTRIFKIDGCDQMWCSNCHKAWSWRTGKIDNGVVHNPHYYEFQRNGGGNVPRAPGDVVCGGLIHYSVLRTQITRRITKKELVTEITKLHRTLAHIIHIDLNALRIDINNQNDHTALRVQYILGNINKDDMSRTLYRNDIARRKNTEMIQVYEILNEVGVDVFATLRNSELKDEKYDMLVGEQLDRYHQLRVYCNQQFEKIGKTYSRKVPIITEQWDVQRRSF